MQKEFEKSLISSVLYNNSIFDDIELKVEDFSDAKHRKIWEAIGTIIHSGHQADYITVVDETKLEADYIASFNEINLLNYPHYVKQIKEKNKLVRLKRLGMLIQESIKFGSVEVIGLIEKEIGDLSDITGSNYNHLKNLLHPHIEEVEKRFKGEYVKNIQSGYDDLDRITQGFRKQELIILGARPAIGKTTMMMNFVHRISKNHNVGVFSLEMNKNLLIDKLISIDSRINLYKLRDGTFTVGEFQKLQNTYSKYFETNIVIDDSFRLTLQKLQSVARKMKRDGAEIIFIDYLTLINYNNRNMQRSEQVGYISKTLKNISRELDIPVCVLSQLKREYEGKEPTLDSLCWSSEIEQDADLVLFLDGERDSPSLRLIIGKHRNGETGKVELTFDRKTGCIL